MLGRPAARQQFDENTIVELPDFALKRKRIKAESVSE
jgi:hypothetical protein